MRAEPPGALQARRARPEEPSVRYRAYRGAIAGEHLPLALVDLDALDANIDLIAGEARAHHKRLRVASKSIRCLPLLRYIADRAREVFLGVMSYAVREAAHLVEHGFDDVIVAYPTLLEQDLALLAALNRRGARAAIVADDEAQLTLLEAAAAKGGAKIPVLVDVDLSYRPLAGVVHLGVRRSPLHDVRSALRLATRIHASRTLELGGLMGYEAQIAGVTDRNPFSPLLDAPRRAMKELSRPHVEGLREELAAAFAASGLPCPVFNGGGSGSLAWCRAEPSLTEVTAGSGFLGSHLFDYYRDVHYEPAALFALQVVRRPAPELVTCHGGGYVASGEAGRDRLPVPFLPDGLELLVMEGAGEVQTPLRVTRGADLELGAPVFFRHAKAGELAEHFSEYLLVRGDHIEGRAPTYRGQGRCFLG